MEKEKNGGEKRNGSEQNMNDKIPEENKGWIESLIVVITQSSVGQTLFKLVDSFLWIIEKSAQWSLPAQELAAEQNAKICRKLELVRPLPWFVFLPGLVILRIIRFGLNVGARILGYPQIQPSGMVRFVQRSRRRLKSVTLRGARPKRRMYKEKTMIEAKKALIRSIRLTLSTLSCLDTSKSSDSPPPMKICVGRTDLEPEQAALESVAKRKYSQFVSDDDTTEGSEDETICDKLEKLADFESADDISFNPTNCSTSSMESSVYSEKNKEVSIVEVHAVTKFFENNKNEIEDENKDQPANTLENVSLSSKNVEKTEDKAEQDVDSSGESVYWSGMEFDEDCDTIFNRATGCPGGSQCHSSR